MQRILLTGKTGQVGWELQTTLAPLGTVIGLDRSGIDLASPDSIRRAIRDAKPDVIVNAAAYNNVDRAESEPGLAMRVNGVAPGIMAEEARRLGAILIHYSTDYVFDGVHERCIAATGIDPVERQPIAVEKPHHFASDLPHLFPWAARSPALGKTRLQESGLRGRH